jgi:UDP:flavonoid glycosyltransferase YjiC (YdhE family)
MLKKEPFKVIISTPFQNAGEALRALEIARELRDKNPFTCKLRIIFLSRGSVFESLAKQEGFEIFSCSPALPGRHLQSELKTRPGEFIGDPALAKAILQGELNAYNTLEPHLIIYGYWAPAGIARRMRGQPIPGIAFFPIPFCEEFLNLLEDFPEAMKPLAYFPESVRKRMVRGMSLQRKLKSPLIRHNNLKKAALSLGWDQKKKLDNIFDMLKADLSLVTDLQDLYQNSTLPENLKITGPVFPAFVYNQDLDPAIRKFFTTEKPLPKIFCTLGSTASRKKLLAALKALSRGAGKLWRALVVIPPAVCSLDKATRCTKGNNEIYLTDQFVPALLIYPLADIVVSHGGQGTVHQTLAAGTPMVSFAMQTEQQFNLEQYLLKRQAGIKILKRKWNVTNIYNSIKEIIHNPVYFKNAQTMKALFQKENGKEKIIKEIFYFIRKKFPALN